MNNPYQDALTVISGEINDLENSYITLGGVWERKAALIGLALGHMLVAAVVRATGVGETGGTVEDE